MPEFRCGIRRNTDFFNDPGRRCYRMSTVFAIRYNNINIGHPFGEIFVPGTEYRVSGDRNDEQRISRMTREIPDGFFPSSLCVLKDNN